MTGPATPPYRQVPVPPQGAVGQAAVAIPPVGDVVTQPKRLRYPTGARPVDVAHSSTSGQFHAGRPPTTHEGGGSSPRVRHTSTVGRLTPSRVAISGMPTGSQEVMKMTVANVLTDDQGCSDTQYMTTTQTPSLTRYIATCRNGHRMSFHLAAAPDRHGFGPSRNCSTCGSMTRSQAIKGTYTEKITCDTRCTGSSSLKCSCSCGGALHGADL